MWKPFRKRSDIRNNRELRDLARRGDAHLFVDIGLDRADFATNDVRLRSLHWWYQ